MIIKKFDKNDKFIQQNQLKLLKEINLILIASTKAKFTFFDQIFIIVNVIFTIIMIRGFCRFVFQLNFTYANYQMIENCSSVTLIKIF